MSKTDTTRTSQNLCRLLQNDRVKMEILSSSLEKIKELLNESHLYYSIKRCKTCGQLFLFEFLEFVDWTNGNDPQYCTWIPIDSIQEGTKIVKKYKNAMYGTMGLESDMRLQRDFKSDMVAPPEYATLIK